MEIEMNTAPPNSPSQSRVIELVRKLKDMGLSPWEISLNIGEVASGRTIRRWIAGDHTPKNAKTVLKPLELLFKRQQKRTTIITTGEKNVDSPTQI
jgi:hypothetical protein